MKTLAGQGGIIPEFKLIKAGIRCGLLAASVTLFGWEAVNAQHVNATPAAVQAAAEPSDSSPENKTPVAVPSLLPPRETVRLLDEARGLITAQRYSEAIERLQEVLLAPDDYFLPDRMAGRDLRSLKAEAELLLRHLPQPAQEFYRLQYGSRAEALLNQAVEARDLAQLLQVWAGFPLAEASLQAGLLAAYWLIQEAHLAEATRILEQVYDTAGSFRELRLSTGLLLAGCYLAQGNRTDCEALLRDLGKETGNFPALFHGQAIQWFSDSESPVDWLEKTFGFRELAPEDTDQRAGSATYPGQVSTRRKESVADAPLLTALWKVRLAEYPEFEDLITHLEELDRAMERPSIPAAMPLVVGEKILCRTLRSLIAIDAQTGKRLWETPPETLWDIFLNSASGINMEWLPVIEQAVRLRVWGDATAGGLSSNGELVFVVEELGWPSAAFYPGVVLGRRSAGETRSPQDWNTLTAYEIHTGKRRWQIVGRLSRPGGGVEKIFFLGAPLCVNERLFVLGYSEGEIRLLELEANSGKRVWQLPLAAIDRPITENWRLRTAGLSPCYHKGILVCPTGARALVGVDILARRLAWLFSYHDKSDSAAEGRGIDFNLAMPIGAGLPPAVAGRTSLIAGDFVIFAGMDSSHIFCLHLPTGRLIWALPRGEVLYIGGVYEGQVLLVEPKALRLVGLDPGDAQARPGPQAASGESTQLRNLPPRGTVTPVTSRWSAGELRPQERRLQLSHGGGVAGIGYQNGPKYFLPLVSGEIAEVDLSRLEVVNILRSVRPVPLGNLVASHGRVLSLSGTGLVMFPDAASLRETVDSRLAADPNDLRARLTLAKILVHEGNYRQAWEELKNLWQREKSPEVREWLREVSLAGLRSDFSYFVTRVPEFEQLVNEPAELMTYLQTLAEGWEKANDFDNAWQAYRRLIEADWASPGWLRLEPAWEVRTSQWLQNRLVRFYESSPANVREQIRRYLTELGPAGKVAEGRPIASIEREKWLTYFGSFPEAGEMALRHAEELAQSGRALAAEYWLNRVATCQRLPSQQDARSALARLYRENQCWAAVARLLREEKSTSSEAASVASASNDGGLTELLSHPAIQSRLSTPDTWPATAKVSSVMEGSLSLPRTRLPIPVVGSAWQAPAEDLRVALVTERPVLVGFDGFGRKLWEFPITEVADLSGFTFFRGSAQALAIGHLVVVKGQTQAIALNTLTVGPQGRATLVWAFDLVRMQPLSLRSEAALREEPAQPGGGQIVAVPDVIQLARLSTDGFQPQMLPVADRYVAFKQRNQLTVVHALTGERLWTRRDLPPKAVVASDRNFIYVFSPDGRELCVYDPELGELVLRAAIPAELVRTDSGLLSGMRQAGSGEPVIVGNSVLCREITSEPGQQTCQRLFLWDFRAGKKSWQSPDLPPNTAFTVYRGKWLGVWYPDSRLEIYRLDTGNLLSECQLPIPLPEAQLRQLEILGNSWQLLVVGLAEVPSAAVQPTSYPPPGVACERISRGVLWACDLDGRPIWTEPVTVSDCWLPVDQPREAPVLVFSWIAASVDRTVASSGQQLSLLVLDRRTGAKLLDTRVPNSGIRLEIEGNPEQKAVRIKLHRTGFLISFSDKPEDPLADEAKSSPNGTLPNLLDLLRRAFESTEPK